MLFNRPNTKENREASRSVQFESLIKRGFKHEVYKDRDIFTLIDDANKRYEIKCFKGTAATPYIYYRFNRAERVTEHANTQRKNADASEKWKAEQKEKNKGHKSSHAACAAMIKENCTKAFPGIKFRVSSDSYSGGNSVRVYWTDGPTVAEVEKISGKHQYGHFNGMEDIYEHTNSRDDIPQVKFVFEERTISEAVKIKVEELIRERYNNIQDWPHYEFDRKVNDVLRHSSIPVGAIITGMELFSNEWILTYETTEEAKPERPATPTMTEGKTIAVVNYSEKAIAVIGEGTREIKDELFKLGGKFNKYLSCGAGWIFSKKRQDDVIKLLTEIKSRQEQIQTGLSEEFEKMQEFIEQTDKSIQPDAKEYTSMKELTEAVNSGQMVSLLNMANLINAERRATQ